MTNIVRGIHKFIMDNNIKKIVVYGCGQIGQKLADVLLHVDGCQLIGFLDNDSHKQGKLYANIPVFSPSHAINLEADLLVVASGDEISATRIALSYKSNFKKVTTVFDSPFINVLAIYRQVRCFEKLDGNVDSFNAFITTSDTVVYDSNKIVLINPPREIPQQADYPPIGLHYLKESLKQQNYNAQVIDGAPFTWLELAEEIKKSDAKYFGVHCWTIERHQAFNTIKLIRVLKPEAKIIAGGQHATAFPSHLLDIGADIVCIGESEFTLVDVLKNLNTHGDLSNVLGIVYKDADGIVENPRRSLISNLDSLPFPRYDEIDFLSYKGLPETEEPAAAIMTSRGCPYECIYCSSSVFWDRKWNVRSPENVLEEIRYLYNEKGIRHFLFFDDNFAVDKKRAIEICRRIINEGLQISWVACTRVDNINMELLKWMKRSGCYRIDFGVESGSSKILKNINKHYTVEQVKQTFTWVHELGIKPVAYLMFGNPGEDEETIDETVKLVKEIKPCGSKGGNILWILPNTSIYEISKNKGIIDDSFWVQEKGILYYTGEYDLEELSKLYRRFIWGICDSDEENG